jgi:hypothetical protein
MRVPLGAVDGGVWKIGSVPSSPWVVDSSLSAAAVVVFKSGFFGMMKAWNNQDMYSLLFVYR